MEIYLPALLFGLAGGLHCAGMCGPLWLSLPFRGTKALIYFTGRLSAYAFIGGMFSLLGQPAALFGMQQSVSIAAGILMLVLYFGAKKVGFFTDSPIFKSVKRLYGKILRSKSSAALPLAGFLNGLLPCGLVYAAAAGAIAAPGPAEGAIYMTVFGLGTGPVTAGVLISAKIFTKFGSKKLTSALVITAALMLIVRGLALGIPYISPSVSADGINISAS